YSTLQAYYKNSASTSAASGQNVILLTSVSSCRTTSSCANTDDELRTEFDFGPTNTGNNLLPVQVTTRNGITGTGALSSVVKNTYDAVGNTIAVDGPVSGTGDTTRTFYDKARRPTGQVGPDPEDTGGNSRLPRAVRTTYDPRGL